MAITFFVRFDPFRVSPGAFEPDNKPAGSDAIDARAAPRHLAPRPRYPAYHSLVEEEQSPRVDAHEQVDRAARAKLCVPQSPNKDAFDAADFSPDESTPGGLDTTD